MDQEKQNEQSSKSREEIFIQENRIRLRYDDSDIADLFRQTLSRLESAARWEDNWRELFKMKCGDIANLEVENAALRSELSVLKKGAA